MISPVLSLNAAVLKLESKVESVESNAGNLPASFLVAVSVEYFLASFLKSPPSCNCLMTSSAVLFFETRMCCTVISG